MGSLGFPDFTTFYKAAQIAQLTKYHSTTEIPMCVFIEAVEELSIAIEK